MSTTTEIKPRSAKQLARSAALLAAKNAKRHAHFLAALCGPRVVGSVCFCGYWRTNYTVTEIDTSNPEHPFITVLWEDSAERGRPAHTTTHCTRWDARGGDRIISQPQETEIAAMEKLIGPFWTAKGDRIISQPEAAQ